MLLVFVLLRNRLTYKKDMSNERVVLVSKMPRLEKLASLDWTGTILFVASGILLLLALNWGSTEEWDQAKVIVSFVVGGVLFVAFIGWLLVLQHLQANPQSLLSKIFPLLPLDMFKSVDVCVTQAIAFTSGMIMLVMFYFVAIFFVIVVGKSASQSGVQLIYFAPGLVSNPVVSCSIFTVPISIF